MNEEYDIFNEISGTEENIVFNKENIVILYTSVSRQEAKEFVNLQLYKKPIQLSEYIVDKKDNIILEFEVNTKNMFDMLNVEHMCKFMKYKQQLIQSNKIDYSKTDIQLISDYARINQIALVRVILKSNKGLYTQYTIQYIALDTKCIKIRQSN